MKAVFSDSSSLRRRWIEILVLAITFSAVEIASAVPFREFYQPLQPPRSLQVMAHRGLAAAAPENTIPAIQAAVEAGFEWVEVDVRRTKEGAHILLHDADLDRTTNGSGPVMQKTIKEIKALDAGAWFALRFAGTAIPTLKEVLSYCKDKINLYLDCKNINPELLVREINDAQMEAQVVVFDSPEMLDKINQLSDFSIAVMPSINEKIDAGYWAKRLRPAAVEIHANLLTPEIAKRFQEAGIYVQAQTLGERDVKDVWRACMDMGVDWIQTDYGENILAEYAWRKMGDSPSVKISAHRGANEFAPENTLAAYRKAIDLGVDYIEIDVRKTKDGRLVSLHDGRLNRTTDGEGPVSEKTLEELKPLSAGAWFGLPYAEERIPTLEEICELVRSHHGPKGPVGLYVDLKDPDLHLLVQILKQYGLAEKNVFYGSPDELLPLRQLLPGAQLMPGLGREEDFDKNVQLVKPYALDTSWNILSKAYIERANQAGVLVFSDAMGFNENVESYLHAIEWGITTIQTDRIPRVFRAIELASQSKR
ncbi:MAG: glycerophosphodiester phosphodiesterase family protein [Candidatus Omnitrophota bacterium]